MFSGIGGFALAASWVWGPEHEIVAFCEETNSAKRYSGSPWTQHWLQAVSSLCNVVHGLPEGLGELKGWRRESIKAMGNAIVPQVAAQIMAAMKEIG